MLQAKVEHIKIIKAKVSEIQNYLQKQIIDGNLVKNFKRYLNEFLMCTDQEVVPLQIKSNIDGEAEKILKRIFDVKDNQTTINIV